ncbi:MAG TPA: dihydrolipoamide acetyltransferase family protein [Solirubrobacterales bacterium]|nr:dihydrolipoamide acetyltransferase family protein [Solirubrobacterales bacterium]
MPDIVMPRLSDSMEEGTILQWLKKVGDEVSVGDELVEIETDKANMAYESDIAGKLTEIVAEEGETLAIGSVIARIGDDGTPPPAKETTKPAEPTPAPVATATEEPEQSAAGDGHRPKASPLARRMAKERGLDLEQLEGSGPGGRIVKADVEKATASAGGGVGGTAPEEASATGRGGGSPAATGPAAGAAGPETAKGEVTYEDPTKTQSLIARRMAESKATAPHFYLAAEVDMSRAVAGRQLIKEGAEEGEVVPSFNDMVVKACALALREHPRANGAYRDGRFELYSRVNVGVAVAARDALVVPTVFDADRKGLRQIAVESRALAQKVREGQIIPPELSGATFTVSNLGMYGVDRFSAVINPPQAAILAVGAIAERPVVRDGEIAAAHLMKVDLACDHRILYGAEGAEFLARVKTLLEEPLSLAL